MALTLPNSSFEPPQGWPAIRAACGTLLAGAAGGASVAFVHLHIRQWPELVAAHGLEAAESALREAEARLTAVLRTGDHLFRSGLGDLCLILPRLLGDGHATLAAQRFLRELEPPFPLDGTAVHLLPTLGVALATDPAESPESLQRRAATAVVHALRDGQPVGIAAQFGADRMVHELRDALARNALELEYQPIVTLPERRVVGYEALARWCRTGGGRVAPSVFIPMAEDAGLAAELTRWSLQVALREFAPLHRRRPDLYCAVNLSARAFDDPSVPEQVLAALAVWQLPPEALMIEVTETAILRNVGQNAQALAELASHGVRLAIDDFGQGYSSLGYLRHLPAGVLKVDQSFVAAVDDPRSRVLLEAITRMGQRLGMRTVAEGVEDDAMLGAALEAGCDFGQGWLFGRPAPMALWLED